MPRSPGARRIAVTARGPAAAPPSARRTRAALAWPAPPAPPPAVGACWPSVAALPSQRFGLIPRWRAVAVATATTAAALRCYSVVAVAAAAAAEPMDERCADPSCAWPPPSSPLSASTASPSLAAAWSTPPAAVPSPSPSPSLAPASALTPLPTPTPTPAWTSDPMQHGLIATDYAVLQHMAASPTAADPDAVAALVAVVDAAVANAQLAPATSRAVLAHVMSQTAASQFALVSHVLRWLSAERLQLSLNGYALLLQYLQYTGRHPELEELFHDPELLARLRHHEVQLQSDPPQVRAMLLKGVPTGAALLRLYGIQIQACLYVQHVNAIAVLHRVATFWWPFTQQTPFPLTLETPVAAAGDGTAGPTYRWDMAPALLEHLGTALLLSHASVPGEMIKALDALAGYLFLHCDLPTAEAFWQQYRRFFRRAPSSAGAHQDRIYAYAVRRLREPALATAREYARQGFPLHITTATALMRMGIDLHWRSGQQRLLRWMRRERLAPDRQFMDEVMIHSSRRVLDAHAAGCVDDAERVAQQLLPWWQLYVHQYDQQMLPTVVLLLRVAHTLRHAELIHALLQARPVSTNHAYWHSRLLACQVVNDTPGEAEAVRQLDIYQSAMRSSPPSSTTPLSLSPPPSSLPLSLLLPMPSPIAAAHRAYSTWTPRSSGATAAAVWPARFAPMAWWVRRTLPLQIARRSRRWVSTTRPVAEAAQAALDPAEPLFEPAETEYSLLRERPSPSPAAALSSPSPPVPSMLAPLEATSASASASLPPDAVDAAVAGWTDTLMAARVHSIAAASRVGPLLVQLALATPASAPAAQRRLSAFVRDVWRPRAPAAAARDVLAALLHGMTHARDPAFVLDLVARDMLQLDRSGPVLPAADALPVDLYRTVFAALLHGSHPRNVPRALALIERCRAPAPLSRATRGLLSSFFWKLLAYANAPHLASGHDDPQQAETTMAAADLNPDGSSARPWVDAALRLHAAYLDETAAVVTTPRGQPSNPLIQALVEYGYNDEAYDVTYILVRRWAHQPRAIIYVTTLLAAYFLRGLASRALAAHHRLSHDFPLTYDYPFYTTMIVGLSRFQSTSPQLLLGWYEAMLAAGFIPQRVLLTNMLRHVARRDDPAAVERLYGEFARHGLQPDVVVYAILIGYARRTHQHVALYRWYDDVIAHGIALPPNIVGMLIQSEHALPGPRPLTDACLQAWRHESAASASAPSPWHDTVATATAAPTAAATAAGAIGPPVAGPTIQATPPKPLVVTRRPHAMRPFPGVELLRHVTRVQHKQRLRDSRNHVLFDQPATLAAAAPPAPVATHAAAPAAAPAAAGAAPESTAAATASLAAIDADDGGNRRMSSTNSNHTSSVSITCDNEGASALAALTPALSPRRLNIVAYRWLIRHLIDDHPNVKAVDLWAYIRHASLEQHGLAWAPLVHRFVARLRRTAPPPWQGGRARYGYTFLSGRPVPRNGANPHHEGDGNSDGAPTPLSSPSTLPSGARPVTFETMLPIMDLLQHFHVQLDHVLLGRLLPAGDLMSKDDARAWYDLMQSLLMGLPHETAAHGTGPLRPQCGQALSPDFHQLCLLLQDRLASVDLHWNVLLLWEWLRRCQPDGGHSTAPAAHAGPVAPGRRRPSARTAYDARYHAQFLAYLEPSSSDAAHDATATAAPRYRRITEPQIQAYILGVDATTTLTSAPPLSPQRGSTFWFISAPTLRRMVGAACTLLLRCARAARHEAQHPPAGSSPASTALSGTAVHAREADWASDPRPRPPAAVVFRQLHAYLQFTLDDLRSGQFDASEQYFRALHMALKESPLPPRSFRFTALKPRPSM